MVSLDYIRSKATTANSVPYESAHATFYDFLQLGAVFRKVSLPNHRFPFVSCMFKYVSVLLLNFHWLNKNHEVYFVHEEPGMNAGNLLLCKLQIIHVG